MTGLLRRVRARLGQAFAPRECSLLFAVNGGSGAWPGMGRALYRDEPTFRESIEATGAVAEAMLGWSGALRFRGEDDEADTVKTERRNDIVRLGMLQIALIDLWREAGVRPGGVLCVSLGEMVAPYAAEALSRDDTARVVAAVAHSVARTPSPNRMFIVRADRAEARRLLRGAPATAWYLGSNGSDRSVLLCAETDAGAIEDFLGERVARTIESGWKYHTPALEPDRQWLREAMSGVRSNRAACPIYSSAAGRALPSDQQFDADYYAWMTSHPFHYREALAAAIRDGFDTALTIGAQRSVVHDIGALAGPESGAVRIIDSMRRGEEEQAWREARAALRRLRIRPRPADAVSAERPDAGAAPQGTGRDRPVELMAGTGTWRLSGYDEVRKALSDTAHFSSDMAELHLFDPVLLGSDPPRHSEVRRALAPHFSSEALARRRRLLEDEANRLVQPLADGHEIDAVHDLAHPLAKALVADIVGVDGADADALAAIGDDPDAEMSVIYARMLTAIESIAERSRLRPALRDSGFSEAEASHLIRLFWIAGTTPQHAVPRAILLLLQNDGIRRRVVEDEALIARFVEEVLRLHPPFDSVPRRAARDIEIGAATIPAGAAVRIDLEAANRDPARFADPLSLRLDRSPNPHFAFGGGVHRCIGARFGQAMLIAALQALFRVAPDFRAVQPLGTVRYAPRGWPREIEELPIVA